MNVIQKGPGHGTINLIKKVLLRKIEVDELKFDVGRSSRDILDSMLVVCGRVGKENIELYKNKAKEIGADFVAESSASWVFTRQTIRKNYDEGKHKGVLLIGTNKELPATQIGYNGAYAFTDWFVQDRYDDGIPDTPVGRVYGDPQTVLYHMDPKIIDSNIAVVFDSQPGRSMRHVESLAELGFDVEVLKKYSNNDTKLLSLSEFVLQFSDGVFTSRIHGTPEQWASHNSVILDYHQAQSIAFEGYPVVFAEACSTAQEGPLLKAFLDQGACYIGATLETMNNIQEYDDWRDCPYCDGWKFGLLDYLDSFDLIGEVKMNVDKEIYEHLDSAIQKQIEAIGKGETTEVSSDQALSTIEWMLFGNPLRRTTVGPEADFTPGKLIVDT